MAHFKRGLISPPLEAFQSSVSLVNYAGISKPLLELDRIHTDVIDLVLQIVKSIFQY